MFDFSIYFNPGVVILFAVVIAMQIYDVIITHVAVFEYKGAKENFWAAAICMKYFGKFWWIPGKVLPLGILFFGLAAIKHYSEVVRFFLVSVPLVVLIVFYFGVLQYNWKEFGKIEKYRQKQS